MRWVETEKQPVRCRASLFGLVTDVRAQWTHTCIANQHSCERYRRMSSRYGRLLQSMLSYISEIPTVRRCEKSETTGRGGPPWAARRSHNSKTSVRGRPGRAARTGSCGTSSQLRRLIDFV